MELKANDSILINDTDQFTVVDVEDGKVVCYPRGGGRQYRIPLDDPKVKIEKVDDFYDIYEDGYALCGWSDDDRKYPSVCMPRQLWNGWNCPEFNKAIFIRMLNEQGYAVYEDGDIIHYYHEDNDELCVACPTENGRYYTDGWCWEFEASENVKWGEEIAQTA